MSASYRRILGYTTQGPAASYERFHAWCAFWGVTGTIRESYNVTSLTHSATGKFIVTFTQAVAATQYAVVQGMARTDPNTTGIRATLNHLDGAGSRPTTTSVSLAYAVPGGTLTDPDVAAVGVIAYV